MDSKRLENILNIFRSEEIAKTIRGFMLKYKIPDGFLFEHFNKFFAEYIKSEIDIKTFIHGVIDSKPVYDLSFSLEDMILEYLRIHLFSVEDLLDEKVEIILNQVRDAFIEIDSVEFGAKNVSEELSDGEFDPFAEPVYIVDEVVNILDLKFNGEEQRERFYDYIIKFIKNIRNKFQTFDLLIKYKKDGGLGIPKNVADKILDIVDDVKHDKENFLLTQKLEEKETVMSKEVDKDEINNKVKDLYKNDVNERKNIIKEYNDNGQNYHIFEGSIEEMYLNQIKSKEEIQDNSVSGGNYKDYSKVKLVGPIEELALFSIKDFRNLSADIKTRISMIERKIKILEGYSTRKKILGIKAWLESEVCNIYKDMIDESVKYGGMSRVINMRRERGDLYLTEEEVEEIAQFNRKLRI